jgi:hypothetical protein
MLQSAFVACFVLLVLHVVASARRQPGYERELRLMVPFVVGTGALVWAVVLVLRCPFDELGTMSPRTIGICVLPLAFTVLSIAGALRAVLALSGRGPNGLARLWVCLHASVVGLAAVGLAAYLVHHHLVGLRTWAW